MPLDQDHDDEKLWSSDPGGASMPLGDHLEELRRRVIHALLGIGVALGVTVMLGFRLIAWITQPLIQAMDILGFPPQTYVTEPTAGFTSVYLPVTLIAAVILASPWVLYQLWKFVAAGLYAHEKKAVHLLVPFSTAMVALGVAFTYYILLPVSLMFFLNFATMYPKVELGEPGFLMKVFRSAYGASAAQVESPPGAAGTNSTESAGGAAGQAHDAADTGEGSTAATAVPAVGALLPVLPVLDAAPEPLPEGGMWIDAGSRRVQVVVRGEVVSLSVVSPRLVNPLPKLDEFIRFASFMGLGVVVAFQLPVVMLVLGWTGLFDPSVLARGRKYAVFFAAILGAALTPTDVFSMIVLAVPLYALFEFGLVVMRWADHHRQRTAGDAGDTDGASEG